MSEPTITNTLDEQLLASEPDAVLLHSILSIPYTVYGLLTYSISQLEIACREILTAIDQYQIAGSMINTRTTPDGEVTLRRIKNLSDLQADFQTLFAKREEAKRRIANRLITIREGFYNLHVETPLTARQWRIAKFRLEDYYYSAYSEKYDRRYLIYLETIKKKNFVEPSASRSATLTTVTSAQAYVESSTGPFSLDGETITITENGVPILVDLPDSSPASFVYTQDVDFDSHEESAPSVSTSGYAGSGLLIDSGICSLINNKITITTGDPIGAGLSSGDVFRIILFGSPVDAYVQSIVDDTTLLLSSTFSFGPVLSGITYYAFYRPELVVTLDSITQTWDLDVDDYLATDIASTLNGQSPTWAASVVGAEIVITGPSAGASHYLMVAGRGATALGFPLDGGPNWLGGDDTRLVEFEASGTAVSKTLPTGPLTISDIHAALSPLPGDGYTLTLDGASLTFATALYGPLQELHWVSGLNKTEDWYYGEDVTVGAVVDAMLAEGVSAKRGTGPNPTIVITATESVLCTSSTLGFPTSTVYGSRTEVSYNDSMSNDTWEGTQRYTWDGEYVQPPMPFSDSASVSVYYGGAASWRDTYNAIHELHESSLTIPEGTQDIDLERIKIFVNAFLTGMGNYAKPVYPSIQQLLEGLDEGQHSRVLQELVVFDLEEAMRMCLIGRKDLGFVSEVLPNREVDMGDTGRGATISGYSDDAETVDGDSYFDLEDDPTALQFPDSLVRY